MNAIQTGIIIISIKERLGKLIASFINAIFLYDNSIVAYKSGSEQNINLVLNTIKAAKEKGKGHCRAATPQ